MQVKCVICDKIEEIDDESLLAKRLKNRRITMYLCQPCHDRIGEKTEEHLASGKFHLYKKQKNKNEFL
ncbi:YlaI family protein [Virgibacillus sp. 179-BFC.A HS]|uniref:YlaI family protein n=1 Tax=Tigheibacillus jepli TaxID=3035914 RepID=A0ABU5CI82_9BACI|nr:YlaI family protein [Virgibacillus sp. 179-BFC.A HS]MDY0406006.1 YlaI family protein [Virgibacillus sp. 179-BFC.A HS]